MYAGPSIPGTVGMACTSQAQQIRPESRRKAPSLGMHTALPGQPHSPLADQQRCEPPLAAQEIPENVTRPERVDRL